MKEQGDSASGRLGRACRVPAAVMSLFQLLTYVLLFPLLPRECQCDMAESCFLHGRHVNNTTVLPSEARLARTTESQPAYLHCRIPATLSPPLSSSQYTVAWTRAADNALLTAGTFSFTSDSRFQISRRSDTDWVLIIRRAEVSDSGCYLCEINSAPISTILPVFLQIEQLTVPHTVPKQMTRLNAAVQGNEVLLNCTVKMEEGGETAEFVDEVEWTRDGKAFPLNDSSKYVVKTKRRSGAVEQTIRIREASLTDDGHYSCSLRQQSASQIVHVNSKPSATASLQWKPLLIPLTSIVIFY